jgi:hypothetical protein
MIYIKKEDQIAFDLENNRPIENDDYYAVNNNLAALVVHLRKNGFNVINSNYPDYAYMYLKQSNVETSNTDVEEVKKEGKQNYEYRRIVAAKGYKTVYDLFVPDRDLYLDFSKDTVLPSIPEGFELIELKNCLRLKKVLPFENRNDWKDEEAVFVNTSYDGLYQWAKEVTGNEIQQVVRNAKDDYGNSFWIIDSKTNEEITTPYMFCDRAMVPTIMTLRKKGYVTRGCCSGHHDKIFIQHSGILFDDKALPFKSESTWIVLSKDVSIPFFPEGGLSKYDKEGLEDEKYPFVRVSLVTDISSGEIFKSSEQIQKELFDSNEKLLKWAMELPDKKKTL